jgi:hypothetical protein
MPSPGVNPSVTYRRPSLRVRDNSLRFDLLIAACGGPLNTARLLGVNRNTLYRWRTGELPLTAERAEQLRGVVQELIGQLSALAYELTEDARRGRERRYRHIVKSTDRLVTMKRKR